MHAGCSNRIILRQIWPFESDRSSSPPPTQTPEIERCKFQNETCPSTAPRSKMSKENVREHFDMLILHSQRISRPLTVLHIGTNDLKDGNLSS